MAQITGKLEQIFKNEPLHISMATKITHLGNLKLKYSEWMCLFTAIKQAGNFSANAFS